MNARNATRHPLAARRQAVVSNALESLETRRLMANLTVTSNADSGAGSLRDAIQTANASLGDDVINFNIAGANKRITLAFALPTITGKTVIDGTTQPGYVAGSSTMVEIRPGTAPDGTNGLVFSSNGGTVRGMMINAFKSNFQTKAGGNGIVVEHGAKNITIEKNYVGTNGSVGIGNAGHGVLMHGSDSVIRDNVVANNFKNGITLSGFQANSNLVAGNNTVPLIGNAVHGIAIVEGANNNTVGGTTAADRNVLAWNKDSGVFIGTVTEGAIASSQNRVIGNWIGLDNAGTTARGNYLAGVKVVGGSDNVIGGTNAGEGNLISGNGKFGVVLHGTDNVKLLGNQIGANAVGDHTPNLDHGIEVAEYAHGVQIGGPTSGERNWVNVATGKYGVRVGDGADTTKIRGNVIGYSSTGKTGPGAESIGVSISNFGNGVVVGGPSASEGNVIANVDIGI